jgi:arginine deiminase
VTQDIPRLLDYPAEILSGKLIEGDVLPKDNLTRFLSKNRYSLQPLHNFLFTRDASMSLWQDILTGRMANKIREREPLILEAVFKEHPLFRTHTYNPLHNTKVANVLNLATLEGGDLLVAREDVVLVGTGTRTSSEGIDFLIELIKSKKTGLRHLIVQELPSEPESFIHLDMTFTFLDRHSCILYEPLILRKNKYQTIHIQIDNGKVKEIRAEDNILQVMGSLGFDIKPVYCGGKGDPLIAEREQWHSAANFLALAPGKVIGYERNDYTLEDLNKNGFEIIRASDFLRDEKKIEDYGQLVITVPGSEIARGGGGPRCLTMPLRREKVYW